jgi:broad specificity phosphatase PhoE
MHNEPTMLMSMLLVVAAVGSHQLSFHAPGACKLIHFVRHAEGTHNEAETNAERLNTYADAAEVLLERNTGRTYWDAPLNAVGIRQSQTLDEQLNLLHSRGEFSPSLIVSSPLRRTLQTASVGTEL